MQNLSKDVSRMLTVLASNFPLHLLEVYVSTNYWCTLGQILEPFIQNSCFSAGGAKCFSGTLILILLQAPLAHG